MRGIIGVGLVVVVMIGESMLSKVASSTSTDGSEIKAQTETIEPSFEAATEWRGDLDGDGRDDLLVLGRTGEVRTLRRNAADGKLALLGDLVLREPDHSLVAVGNVFGDAQPEFVVVDRKGANAYAITDGVVAGKPVPLARRARSDFRTGHPRPADILQDVNSDGHLDLVLPKTDSIELWSNEKITDPKSRRSRMKKAATVEVSVRVRAYGTRGKDGDQLIGTVRVPNLDIRDVNGDDRLDLVVWKEPITSFHLQREDGSIPPKPDVVLDLDRFRDTTPKADVRPGRTLAGTEKARYLRRDIDGDGIPDYVIGHRRKVWVFHGRKSGPQFTEPTTIMRTADDITALWLARLDDDADVDLMIFRIEVPTVGTLLTGLLGSFSVDIRVTGFSNRDGRTFDTKPKWRRDIEIKLPSVGEVLRNPAAILERFETAGRKFRQSIVADFDGDDRDDLVLPTVDGNRLDVWWGREKPDQTIEDEWDDVLRRLLFENKRTEWDVDSMVTWVEELAAREESRMTRGRKPSRTVPLRDAAEFDVAAMHAVEVDRIGAGQGGEFDLVIAYDVLGGKPRRLYDVTRLRTH